MTPKQANQQKALSSKPADNNTYRCADGATTPPDLSTISQFTSTFGEHYRHSNPNDPNNLGGFDKRLFRNNVRFQKDFRQYGSLSL